MYLPYDERARHPPAGRHASSSSSPGTGAHAAGQVPAAAALPPARDLPPPGAQAGRRRAGDVPAQRHSRRVEAPQLRLLRPDHDRRLVTVRLCPGDHGRRGRLRRPRRQLLQRVALPRPRRHPRQHLRRRPHRLRPAACGARSSSASPGSTTRARRFGSRRACRRRGSVSRSGCTTRVADARPARCRRCTVHALDGPPVPIESERSQLRWLRVEPWRVAHHHSAIARQRPAQRRQGGR